MDDSRNAAEAADLAVIVVSANSAKWLRRCLSSVYESAGGLRLDVVVVDNESADGTRQLVEAEFPVARVVSSPNRGFAHANNRGLLQSTAPFVLFLNPDTEIITGTLEELVSRMRARPSVGLVGVRHAGPAGELHFTIRRSPSVSRTFFEALGSERFPLRASWLGERELDPAFYDRDVACDWTTGAFMLARREALLAAGLMDERFFLYAEEPDLCLRMRRAGWEVRHIPVVTIVHHGAETGWNPRLEAQRAFSRTLYMRKHFPPARRAAGLLALGLGLGLRSVVGGFHLHRGLHRKAARRALLTILGLAPPPFGRPPPGALSAEHLQSSGRYPARR